MAYTHEQLADIEAIREATKHYSHGLDRLDAEWMRRAYWPDATDDHGYFVGNAWEFVDLCMMNLAKRRSSMHCIFNDLIELDTDPNFARGELYNVTYLFGGDSGGLSIWCGRYLDRYQKRNGEWRILERVCVHEGTTAHADAPMQIAAEKFRQGSFDRPSKARPIGP